MKNLWAPWRIQYILSEKPKGCFFCQAPKKGQDREVFILYRARHTYVIMNIYPYNNGHLMVVPYEHRPGLEGLPDAALAELMSITRYSLRCLREAMNPDGFNIGINIGTVAGAGLKEHLHVHIVPRWNGDTSFMAVLDEVRVIPQHIRETYELLWPIFNQKRD